MPQKIEILQTLPGASLQAIKDGWRAIALVVLKNKRAIADRVWSLLRTILKVGWTSDIAPDQSRELVDLISEHRVEIIELLQDKECLKVIHGRSKREKETRVKLAWEVLDEVLTRITDYQPAEK